MRPCIAAFALALAFATVFAPARSSSAPAPTWRALFQTIIPAAATDFRPLRGAFDPTSANFAVKAPFYPQLVRDCIVFQSGAGDSHAWDLRCRLEGYPGQAMGPATPDGSLVHDLSSGLPRFRLGKNMMGEPQWTNGTSIAVTIVFGGILITHGYTGT